MGTEENRKATVTGKDRTPELARLLLTSWSPSDSSVIYHKVKIFDSLNVIKIKLEDYIDIGKLLTTISKVSYKIQEYSNRKEDCNIEGKPAIVVTFISDEKNITMKVMHGHSGKPFDKDDIFHKYEMIVDRTMFETYHNTLSNNALVEGELKQFSQEKKVLEL